MTQKKDAPHQVIKWELAEHFGWTLDYAESISMEDWHEWEQIKDGRAKASSSLLTRKGG